MSQSVHATPTLSKPALATASTLPRPVDQVEEPGKALAEIFAAAAGVAHLGDAAQLTLQRARVQKRRRLPVDGGPRTGDLPARHGLRGALSRRRLAWTRQ